MASGKNKALLRFSNCMICTKKNIELDFELKEIANGKTSSFHSAIRRVHWLRYFLACSGKLVAE